jgi:hypothetical protein
MAANRNRLMPQVERCGSLLLPSAIISHAAFDHPHHAEVQVRIPLRDFVGFRAADHGGASDRNHARVHATPDVKHLLTQPGSTTGGKATHVGPNMRIKSSANQAPQTNNGHPAIVALTGLTKGWGILAAQTTTGAPIALGLTIAPPSPGVGPATNGSGSAHPDPGSKGANPALANQFGDKIRSSSDPLFRDAKERLAHATGEWQRVNDSSPHHSRTESTSPERRENADEKAGLETALNEDHSPLRPPSPDSNCGLQSSRYTPSPEPLADSELTSASAYSDPLQPRPRGKRFRIEFLKALMMIREFWKF